MQQKPIFKTLKNSGVEKETQYEPQPIKNAKKSKESIKELNPSLNFGKWDDREN